MLIGFPVTVKIQVALREGQSRPLSVFVSLLIVPRQNIFTIKVNLVGFFGDKKSVMLLLFSLLNGVLASTRKKGHENSYKICNECNK